MPLSRQAGKCVDTCSDIRHLFAVHGLCLLPLIDRNVTQPCVHKKQNCAVYASNFQRRKTVFFKDKFKISGSTTQESLHFSDNFANSFEKPQNCFLRMNSQPSEDFLCFMSPASHLGLLGQVVAHLVAHLVSSPELGDRRAGDSLRPAHRRSMEQHLKWCAAPHCILRDRVLSQQLVLFLKLSEIRAWLDPA